MTNSRTRLTRLFPKVEQIIGLQEEIRSESGKYIVPTPDYLIKIMLKVHILRRPQNFAKSPPIIGGDSA
jgi:hypothetical protein